MIQQHKLDEAAFRGERFKDWPHDLKGCNDLLVLTRPELIEDIHGQFLEAGADIVATNTFNATSLSLADYHLEELVYELNCEAVKLARRVADAQSQKLGRTCYVAGGLGPTSKTASISPDVNDPGYRAVTFDQLVATYSDATRGLIDGGADAILIETIFDTLNAKAAIYAVRATLDAAGVDLPIIISGTITDASGRTLSGQTVEAFWASVRHARPITISLNCALGVKQLRPYVEELARLADTNVGVYPNAGSAQRFRRIRRSARGHRQGAGRARACRPSEFRRRLLRHHARAHQGDCRSRALRAGAQEERTRAAPRALRARSVQSHATTSVS